MALTGKRRVFIEQYLACWNATEAARRAGYKYPDRQGYRLLRNVEIQALVEQRLDEMAVPANEVLARLGQQARASIGDFVTTEGKLDWAAIKAKGHLVKRIVQRGDSFTLELHSAQTALIHLDKEHGGKDGAPIPTVIEDATLTEPERVARIVALLDRARARRDAALGADGEQPGDGDAGAASGAPDAAPVDAAEPVHPE